MDGLRLAILALATSVGNLTTAVTAAISKIEGGTGQDVTELTNQVTEATTTVETATTRLNDAVNTFPTPGDPPNTSGTIPVATGPLTDIDVNNPPGGVGLSSSLGG